MLDTVRLDFLSPLPTDFLPVSDAPAPCTFYSRAIGSKVPGSIHTLTQADTRLFLDTHGSIHACEVSLPRLLHRNNSFLLQSQADIDRALHRLQVALFDVTTSRSSPLASAVFSRVDLALNLQLQGLVREFLQVMAQVPHRHGRSHTAYSREGLTFGKRKSPMITTFYDKEFQMERRPGSILRIEIRLRASKLKELLGPDDSTYPSSLCFDRCYAAFRTEMRKFSGPRISVCTPSSKKEFVAQAIHLLDTHGIRFPDGRSPLQVLEAVCGSPATVQGYRRTVNALNLHSWNFDFPSEFPEAWPPPRLAPYVPDPLERYSPAFQHQNSELSGPQSLQPA